MSVVRFRPKAPCAVVAQLVERHLAKVEVASPSLVYRSMYWRDSQVVRQRSAKPSFTGSNPVHASSRILRSMFSGVFCLLEERREAPWTEAQRGAAGAGSGLRGAAGPGPAGAGRQEETVSDGLTAAFTADIIDIQVNSRCICVETRGAETCHGNRVKVPGYPSNRKADQRTGA